MVRARATAAIEAAQTTELPNGVRIPLLGIGTTHSGGYSHEAVVYALRDCGYRMIDTAKRYGVEAELEKAMAEAGIPREDIFLTSKLWPGDFGAAAARRAFRESSQRLGTDYLDLYLVHFPVVPDWFHRDPREVREETWRALERLYDEGLCKAIGVSNYGVSDLEELLEYCSVKPHANQIEFHPYQNPKALRQFCADNGIAFTGYSPLAKGTILREAPVLEVAKRCGRSPAQVCIRWSIQQGVPAIPKSLQPHRLRENFQVFEFHLSSFDMEILNNLHDETGKVVPVSNLQEKFRLPDGYKLKTRNGLHQASH